MEILVSSPATFLSGQERPSCRALAAGLPHGRSGARSLPKGHVSDCWRGKWPVATETRLQMVTAKSLWPELEARLQLVGRGPSGSGCRGQSKHAGQEPGLRGTLKDQGGTSGSEG